MPTKKRNKLYDQPEYRAARKRLYGLPCHWCGQIADTVDHVVPVVHGGDNKPGNLVPACGHCNSKRGQAIAAKRRRGTRLERAKRRW